MSAVETWITRNTHWIRRGMKVGHKWGIVRTEEIAVAVGANGRGPQVSYTSAHTLSARFTTHLHRMIGSSSSASWPAKFVASAFAFVTASLGALRGRSGEDAPEECSRAMRHEQERKRCRKGSEKNYCNASINRVMVRFRSLSDRRISSILWIECSTVVWCLPPNWRPISGSDAVVSCLTMYVATCRGKAIARVLLRTFKSCSRKLKCSLTRFWIRSIVTRFSCDAMMLRSTC